MPKNRAQFSKSSSSKIQHQEDSFEEDSEEIHSEESHQEASSQDQFEFNSADEEQDEEQEFDEESGEYGEEEGEYDDLGVEFDIPGQEKKKSLAEILAEAEKAKKDPQSNEKDSNGKQPNRGKGVVYISRVPPGMTVPQLRSLLSPFGDIGRIWVEIPEHIASKKQYSKAKIERLARRCAREGWVEFEKAKYAYKTAKLLNCQPIGRGNWKGDLWTLKYLKDFSWNDLVAQHIHRKKMREQRLKQSLSRAKHEAHHFMENRNKQAYIDSKKKRARPDDSDNDNDGDDDQHKKEDQPQERSQRPNIRTFEFEQAKVKPRTEQESKLDNNLLMKLMGGGQSNVTNSSDGKEPPKKKHKAN